MPLKRLTWRLAPWLLPSAVAAAVSLLAGFQAAAWWADSGRPPSERLVYRDRPVAGFSLPQPGAAATPSPASQEDWRQLAADMRELRRALNQVMVERDQALARLGALRSAPTMATGPETSVAAKPAPLPPASETPAPLPAAAGVELAAATKPSQPRLAGTWIYSPPGGRTSPSDQYPAEYIELVLLERDDLLTGPGAIAPRSRSWPSSVAGIVVAVANACARAYYTARA